MKRQMKKGLAIVLALVMVFAMTATAFANTNGSVSVQVIMEGEAYIDEVVTDASIAASADGNAHLYNVPIGLSQPANYTAADALIQAWYQFYGATSYGADQISYCWDTSKVGKEGLYFDIYDGVSADAGNYHFVRSYQGLDENGKTVTYYEYYWSGNTWNLYIDGSSTPADKYASRYATSDIDSVQFVYAETRSENFSVKTPIQGAL